MKVGVINVTGYSGSELVRLLYRHPDVKISSVTGRSAAGQKLQDCGSDWSGKWCHNHDLRG